MYQPPLAHKIVFLAVHFALREYGERLRYDRGPPWWAKTK